MSRLLVALALLALAGCGPSRTETGGSASTAGGGFDESNCASLGAWRHEHPSYASDIAICAEPDGTTWVRQSFADGSTYRNALTPIAGAAGPRFLRDPAATDYYELLPDGRLEIGDEQGVIVTVDPLR